MADSTPAGILLVLTRVSAPLVLSSVEGRVRGEQGSPAKTANFETRCGASFDKCILSCVEGLRTGGELGKLTGVE